jgi:hypothetical protein
MTAASVVAFQKKGCFVVVISVVVVVAVVVVVVSVLQEVCFCCAKKYLPS